VRAGAGIDPHDQLGNLPVCTRLTSGAGYSSGRAGPVPGRPMRSGARDVMIAYDGDKSVTEEGDTAVAMEFDARAVVR
jgi:hypothetical protein